MTTASDIERRALRLLNVLDASEAMEANVEQDARQALNNLGQRWLASGLIAAWTDAALPTSVLVTPSSANEALADNLALLLSPEYARPVDALAPKAAQSTILLWRDRLAPGDYTTALDLIKRALRLLFDAGKLPDTVSFAGALATLNGLLDEWDQTGFGFDAPLYPTTSAAIALIEADWDAVATNLALRLCREYGVEIPPTVATLASATLMALYGRYAKPVY